MAQPVRAASFSEAGGNVALPQRLGDRVGQRRVLGQLALAQRRRRGDELASWLGEGPVGLRDSPGLLEGEHQYLERLEAVGCIGDRPHQGRAQLGFPVEEHPALLLQHYGVLASRLGGAGVAPPTTMLGVTRLAVPVLVVELEGTAVA